MSKQKENLAAEFKAWLEKHMTEWAFSDEKTYIVYFNSDGTITYQQGFKTEEDKQETYLQPEQIAQIVVPESEYNLTIYIDLKPHPLYGKASLRLKISKEQLCFVDFFLVPWIEKYNIKYKKGGRYD